MIDWLSKKQSIATASVFGTEFCAMRHGVETLYCICYKRHMMGILMDKPSYVYGNNVLIIMDVSKPESTLKKKLSSIC